MEMPKDGTLKLIDDAILDRASKEKSRSYMGGSILGTECDRQLWYSYKRPWKVDSAKLQRIFDLGNILEDYVIKLLKDAGITVFAEDENGKQFGFVDGEIAGHSDGVLLGLPESSKPHLFECKSANDKSYKLVEKNGVEKWNEKYWAQIHVYMKKLNLERCLFVVINKNTCELYIERIKYDRHVANHYLLRGHDIASRQEPPTRKYHSKTFYKCKFCNFAKECWDE